MNKQLLILDSITEVLSSRQHKLYPRTVTLSRQVVKIIKGQDKHIFSKNSINMKWNICLSYYNLLKTPEGSKYS